MSLKLIKDLGPQPAGKRTRRKGLYLCHCGKEFETQVQYVKSGGTKSCGCSTEKHGMSKTKEYHSWSHMRDRCYNKNNKRFKDYGGRGISVCDRWFNSFNNFYLDMKDCPEGYSLDRIDVNGNYEPDNCRWSDSSEQHYNTRVRSNNTSGVPGVTFNTKTGKYQARISKGGIEFRLGYFYDIEDAIKARHEAEILYYGTFKIKIENT